MAWIVSYIAPNCEFTIQEWLTARDYQCFVPCGKHNVKRRRTKQPDIILRPAFPCYVFVRMPVDWNVLHRHPQFRYAVQVNGTPITMEDDAITKIMIMERDGEFDNLYSAPSIAFRIGEHATVIGSAFDGMVGRILSVPKSDFGNALLEVGNKKVIIPVNQLTNT